MQNSSIISNQEKFLLYSHYYKSVGFNSITYINGFFGKKNILRIFTLQDFFKYYDNEILRIKIALKGNTYWFVFDCIKEVSPIFKYDVVNNHLDVIYEADELVNDNTQINDGVATTALSSSAYFSFKNIFRIKTNNFKGWCWWKDIVICELKDVVESKISYQILHIDEIELYDNININHSQTQYDFVQQFKKPISYFRKRKQETELYGEVEWKSYFWNSATGIGVISGGNSFRCIDIDGCSSFDFVTKFLYLLGLNESYSWIVRTGSKNGFHIWIKTEKLPNNLLMNAHAEKLFKNAGFIVFEPKDEYKTIFKRIELRWKSHIVMPPSKSGYGYYYEFVYGLPNDIPQTISSDSLLSTLNAVGYNTALNYEEIIHCKITSVGPSIRRYNLYQTVILVLDLETTGLAKDYKDSFDNVDNWPYIVQISYQILSGYDNDILKEADYILRPENFVIPESSILLHGITNDIANEKGWDRKDFYKYFVEQLKAVHYIVAHNADFDVNVLKCELLRYTEMTVTEINALFSGIHVICTMKASVDLCKILRNSNSSEYKYPKLNELYNHLFGKGYENPHNSLFDVRATTECFLELSKKGIIDYCKNSPIKLNFVSENNYCCQCGGILRPAYCSFPKYDWNFDYILQCSKCKLFYVAGYRTDDDLYF